MLIDMAQFLIEWSAPSLLIKGWNAMVRGVAKLWDKMITYITDLNWWKAMLVKMKEAALGGDGVMSIFGKIASAITGIDYTMLAQLDTTAAEEKLKEFNQNMQAQKDEFETGWEIPNIYEGLADSLEGLKDPIKEREHQFMGFVEAMKQGATEARAYIDNLLGNIMPTGAGGGGGGGGDGTPALVNPFSVFDSGDLDADTWLDVIEEIDEGFAEAMGNIEGERVRDMEGWENWQKTLVRRLDAASAGAKFGLTELWEVMSQMMDPVQMVMDAMTQMATVMGQAIGNALSGAVDAFETPLQKILLIVFDFVKQLGATLIKMGTALLFVPGFQVQGAVFTAAGVILTALAGAGTAAIKNKVAQKRDAQWTRDSDQVQGLASGGFVGSGGMFMVGENGPEMVNLPAGSAVTPMSMASGSIQVQGRIVGKGEDFVVIIEEAERRRNNIN